MPLFRGVKRLEYVLEDLIGHAVAVVLERNTYGINVLFKRGHRDQSSIRDRRKRIAEDIKNHLAQFTGIGLDEARHIICDMQTHIELFFRSAQLAREWPALKYS